MTEWISLREAAKKLPVSEATLLRRLKEGPKVADEFFGAGNWRRKPLLRRKIYQLNAEWVAQQNVDDSASDSRES